MGFTYSSKLFGGIGSGGGTIAPGGLTAGRVALSYDADSVTDSADLTFNDTTNTLTTEAISVRNVTATALATPVITPPVSPVLSLLTTVTVVAGASLVDGDYFTLSDGSAVVYEFDDDASVTSGRVGITFAGTETAQEIRDLVIIAINGSTLGATAIAAGADTLTVTSDLAGDTMGVNSENVADAGFLVPVWGEPTHVTTYGYKVVAYLPDGTSTAASAEVQTTTGHATLSGANYNAVTWGAVTGASSYRLYRVTGTPAGGDAPPRLLYTGTLVNFSDTNAASTSEVPATVDGTGVVTGDRLVGVATLGNGTTVAAGTGTATARVGGVLYESVTTATTTGASEEILASYTLPGGTLSVDGRGIRIMASATHAANTNAASMRIRFGGIGGTIVASQSSSANSATYLYEIVIRRTGAATQISSGVMWVSSTTGTFGAAPTQTLASDVSIVVTGITATAAGDVIFNSLSVEAL